MSVDDITGRKSPGNEAESATPRGKDPPAPPCSRRRARGQLAIATVMWPVETQSTNRTGLTLVLTLSPFPHTGRTCLQRCHLGASGKREGLLMHACRHHGRIDTRGCTSPAPDLEEDASHRT